MSALSATRASRTSYGTPTDVRVLRTLRTSNRVPSDFRLMSVKSLIFTNFTDIKRSSGGTPFHVCNIRGANLFVGSTIPSEYHSPFRVSTPFSPNTTARVRQLLCSAALLVTSKFSLVLAFGCQHVDATLYEDRACRGVEQRA